MAIYFSLWHTAFNEIELFNFVYMSSWEINLSLCSIYLIYTTVCQVMQDSKLGTYYLFPVVLQFLLIKLCWYEIWDVTAWLKFAKIDTKYKPVFGIQKIMMVKGYFYGHKTCDTLFSHQLLQFSIPVLEFVLIFTFVPFSRRPEMFSFDKIYKYKLPESN